jgi:hypothetical protein
MKKLFLLLLITYLFSSCQKDNSFDEKNSSSVENFLKSGNSLTICHHTGNGWQIININPNAWLAHESHGDAQDMDGDGYFDRSCGCSDMVDCNDQDATVHPGAEEICDNGIDDNCNGEIDEGCDPAIDESSLLFVNMGTYILEVLPVDETANWNVAVSNCGGTFFGNSDWYLPSKEELNNVYEQLGPSSNGFGGSGVITTGEYWSSSNGRGIVDKWIQDFENGNQSTAESFFQKRYRCVRKQ